MTARSTCEIQFIGQKWDPRRQSKSSARCQIDARCLVAVQFRLGGPLMVPVNVHDLVNAMLIAKSANQSE